MTFSMPSPVELTQLKIQYQRNVGTPRASKRIELGATAPAPGSTSSASTFRSVTASRLREPRVAPVSGACASRGCPGDPPGGGGEETDGEGGEGAASARLRTGDRTRGSRDLGDASH